MENCPTQRLVKTFFYFFQTLARYGHPKVENLVFSNQDYSNAKWYFFFFLDFFFQIPQIYEYN
jgi:hypothetical protein